MEPANPSAYGVETGSNFAEDKLAVTGRDDLITI
jgi:hypothetical protein